MNHTATEPAKTAHPPKTGELYPPEISKAGRESRAKNSRESRAKSGPASKGGCFRATTAQQAVHPRMRNVAWFNCLNARVAHQEKAVSGGMAGGTPACPGFLIGAREFIPAWGRLRSSPKRWEIGDEK